MSKFFYKFLSNPSNTVKVYKDDSVVYNVLIKGVDKETKKVVDLTSFCNIYSNPSFYNIKINADANISNSVNFDGYNVGVYLIPTLSILNFSSSSLNELDRLYYQANHILNFLIEANQYCIKMSELDNINNIVRYYNTKNNTYIAANKINTDIFLGYANNNILSSPNTDNGSNNTVLPEPDDLQKKILSIADAQEWADFFGTIQKEDIDDSHEKPLSGTVKIIDFGVSNLSSSWIECKGQTLDKTTYNNIYEAKKTLINCNFPAFNAGVGYISTVTDNISATDMQKEEFVQAVSTSQDLLYAKLGSNPPIQILDAGYVIVVQNIINFTPGDVVKVIINNTYVLYNARFVDYRGGYGIIVCRDYNSYKTISKNNIVITKIDLYGVENYSNAQQVSVGNVIPNISKTYLNIANFYAGVGIRFDDNINGLAQVEMLFKNGLKLDNGGNIVLPNPEDTLMSNNLSNICYSSTKTVTPEDLSFDNTLSLNHNGGLKKNYLIRQNLLYKGFYFSDTAALNFQDPMPDFYVHLYAETTNYRYGVSTQIFLIPFYTMLATGISLVTIGTVFVSTGQALGTLGLVLVILGGSMIATGGTLVTTATAVITTTIAASRSIKTDIYYTFFLQFINNSQQTIDVRQKSLQLYKMYIHE